MLACLLAASIWAPGAAGAQTAGQIAGTVTDVTGGALREATVTLRGPADRVARTDESGRFAFPDLPAGDYDVAASLSPFLPARRTLTLGAGASATVLVHALGARPRANQRHRPENGRARPAGDPVIGERPDG